tara:strand:- start:84 stop:431 length:348 start_codon:yes stop_codon:yes gene_type:complete
LTSYKINEVINYHAHIYFDDFITRRLARELRSNLNNNFNIKLGGWKNNPVGPHTKPMYMIVFGSNLFSNLVPWLMLNRNGLSILIHPQTNDEMLDHTEHCIWMGKALYLDTEKLN